MCVCTCVSARQVLGPRQASNGQATGRPFLGNKLTAEALRILDQPAYVVAQRAVSPQWTFQGRNCYVRVWAVITSVDPLRYSLLVGGCMCLPGTRMQASMHGLPSGCTLLHASVVLGGGFFLWFDSYIGQMSLV